LTSAGVDIYNFLRYCPELLFSSGLHLPLGALYATGPDFLAGWKIFELDNFLLSGSTLLRPAGLNY
jgi:hypothetical protein